MSQTASLSIAMTGGAGRVGVALRRVMSARFAHVRVIDLVEPSGLHANETFVEADVSDLDALTAAFEGLDAIVHLAGHPGERPIADILKANVLGTSNVYEAARRTGIGRVVFGSSNHATGFYPRDVVVATDDPMRPDSLYGLSKCWGELVAGLYYDKAGIRSLNIRIGNALDRPTTPRALEVWISPGDLAQLCVIGLTHPDLEVTTAFGVSAGGGNWWDNSAVERLGYVPQDRIADFAAPEAFAPVPDDADPVGEYFQGAGFCILEHDGVIRRR